MPDNKTFHIQFPGDLTLEVHLQNPHPVNLTVRFPDQVSHVDFSYSPDSGGQAKYFGSFERDSGAKFEIRVRPSSPAGASATLGSPMNIAAIEFNDPGGSRGM